MDDHGTEIDERAAAALRALGEGRAAPSRERPPEGGRGDRSAVVVRLLDELGACRRVGSPPAAVAVGAGRWCSAALAWLAAPAGRRLRAARSTCSPARPSPSRVGRRRPGRAASAPRPPRLPGIVVHAAGAVGQPGLYRLPPGRPGRRPARRRRRPDPRDRPRPAEPRRPPGRRPAGLRAPRGEASPAVVGPRRRSGSGGGVGGDRRPSAPRPARSTSTRPRREQLDTLPGRRARPPPRRSSSHRERNGPVRHRSTACSTSGASGRPSSRRCATSSPSGEAACRLGLWRRGPLTDARCGGSSPAAAVAGALRPGAGAGRGRRRGGRRRRRRWRRTAACWPSRSACSPPAWPTRRGRASPRCRRALRGRGGAGRRPRARPSGAGGPTSASRSGRLEAQRAGRRRRSPREPPGGGAGRGRRPHRGAPRPVARRAPVTSGAGWWPTGSRRSTTARRLVAGGERRALAGGRRRPVAARRPAGAVHRLRARRRPRHVGRAWPTTSTAPGSPTSSSCPGRTWSSSSPWPRPLIARLRRAGPVRRHARAARAVRRRHPVRALGAAGDGHGRRRRRGGACSGGR